MYIQHRMPPLLAALLMIELHCDMRAIKAIDLNMEWKRNTYGILDLYSNSWYLGYVPMAPVWPNRFEPFVFQRPYHKNQ